MSLSNLVVKVVMLLLVSLSVSSQNESNLSRFYDVDKVQIVGPGMISTSMGEYSPTFDIRRNELYFMRRTPGRFDYTIYKSVLSTDGWSEPAIVSFSGQHRDAGPYLSPDGETILFDSRRPDPKVAENSINLWYSKRLNEGWSEPELLVGPSINKPDEPVVGQNEYGPAMDEQGVIYFYSFRQPYRGGARYLANPPKYNNIQMDQDMPDPSARTFVSYLYLSPDGKLAIMEGRARGRNDTDLYCSSKKPDGVWTEPVEIPDVNTTFGEGGPFLTADGQYLLFTSDRPTTDVSVSNANLFITGIQKIYETCATKK